MRMFMAFFIYLRKSAFENILFFYIIILTASCRSFIIHVIG